MSQLYHFQLHLHSLLAALIQDSRSIKSIIAKSCKQHSWYQKFNVITTGPLHSSNVIIYEVLHLLPNAWQL